MLFATPVPFKEAVQSRAVRELLPTEFRTALLAEIPAELRERAFFSAGVTQARVLQTISDRIDKIADGNLDRATARLEIKQLHAVMGYQPAEGEVGTLTDLSSDLRIDLQIDMGVRQAQGYGNWMQGQQPSVLDQWPAQELIDTNPGLTTNRRDWVQIWADAGGQFFDGRMIALKNDPIWVAISRFSLPYPPFDFGSYWDVRDIDRDEAMALGLITRDEQITPQDRGFNDGLEAALGVGESIAKAVQALFGDRAKTDSNGVLRWVGGAA